MNAVTLMACLLALVVATAATVAWTETRRRRTEIDAAQNRTNQAIARQRKDNQS